MTYNTLSGSTVQCNMWLLDDITLNSPRGSTLQCDTLLCDDMTHNSLGGSTVQCNMWLWNGMKQILATYCSVTRETGEHCHMNDMIVVIPYHRGDDMTLNSLDDSTVQCDTWLRDDITYNSPGGSNLQCQKLLWDDMTHNQHHAM